jgi:hypothetical protein
VPTAAGHYPLAAGVPVPDGVGVGVGVLDFVTQMPPIRMPGGKQLGSGLLIEVGTELLGATELDVGAALVFGALVLGLDELALGLVEASDPLPISCLVGSGSAGLPAR